MIIFREKTDSITESAGARLIAVDRSGYGESSFHANCNYRACADDVSQLLDHLQLSRAAVLGYSSGGPNAMACAVQHPGLFSACGLISSDGPYSQIGGDIVQTLFHVPAVTPAISLERTAAAHADLREAYASMKNEWRREVALADLERAVQQGYGAGPAKDALLETGAWDFNVADIDTAAVPVLLWHGDADGDVPPSVGRYLADNIPGVQAEFVEGESHSMIRRRWGNILTQIIEKSR